MATERLLVSDAPVGRDLDRLDLRRYVGPLAEVIVSEGTDTPFTIGVFGPWGSGKSSLLRMVGEALDADHPERTVRVEFNPWVHRKEPNMLLPLLHTLQDTLARDAKARFGDTVRRLSSVISTLTTNILLGRVSGGAIQLDDIKSASEEYSKAHGEVESEMRNLRSTLQSEADRLAAKDVRLVIMVDDLDRCEPDEIIDLLESLKLFFDLRNVFVVLAIAKDVVDRGVALKYREFNFGADKVIEIGNDYLDKIIQLPLYLSAFEESAIGAFLHGLDLPRELVPHIDLLKEIVYPNPRHIKRVLNLAAFTNVVARNTADLPEFRLDLLLRLIVIRIQSPSLYKAIKAGPSLLVDLESVYQGTLYPTDANRFVRRHGTTRAVAAQEAVVRFHHAEPYYEALFAGSAFAAIEPHLREYMSLLGD
ncbi:hypothetical protein Skr01_75670 [Sphaerisporangium krabiense]|uniref:KAP NTPase domain-containing protein n=1 Tax=Sphaerisporangium krabiense TaxID=763782 RepID=A0A7W8Z2A4_9ACTN|nr:P-loop NTPase fold protein [Sphaerisporangium krabiense]MBB5626114.1 hypothetical protein [Sphaerisporangium krabiense]GII67482.1 hypothetical protein Skr01_75670 [Sphaerisporangium krabiense]